MTIGWVLGAMLTLVVSMKESEPQHAHANVGMAPWANVGMAPWLDELYDWHAALVCVAEVALEGNPEWIETIRTGEVA